MNFFGKALQCSTSRNTVQTLLQCNSQISYFDTYFTTITRCTEKRLLSILSRHLFLDNILTYKNKHENEHITSIMPQRGTVSVQFPRWEDIDGNYPFLPPHFSFTGRSAVVRRFCSRLTTYLKKALIGWKSSVGC